MNSKCLSESFLSHAGFIKPFLPISAVLLCERSQSFPGLQSYPNLFSKFFEIILSAQTMINITVTFMFHSFFQLFGKIQLFIHFFFFRFSFVSFSDLPKQRTLLVDEFFSFYHLKLNLILRLWLGNTIFWNLKISGALYAFNFLVQIFVHVCVHVYARVCVRMCKKYL